jgi:hypothetical protein
MVMGDLNREYTWPSGHMQMVGRAYNSIKVLDVALPSVDAVLGLSEGVQLHQEYTPLGASRWLSP